MASRKLSPRSSDPWTKTTVATPGAGAGRVVKWSAAG